MIPAVLFLVEQLTGAYANVTVASTALFVFLLGMRVALGSRWGGEVVNWIFGIIGIIGTALSVIAILATQGS